MKDAAAVDATRSIRSAAALHMKALDAARVGGPQSRAMFPQMRRQALAEQDEHIAYLRGTRNNPLWPSQVNFFGRLDAAKAERAKLERYETMEATLEQAARIRNGPALRAAINTTLRTLLDEDDIGGVKRLVDELISRQDVVAFAKHIDASNRDESHLRRVMRRARADLELGLEPDIIGIIGRNHNDNYGEELLLHERGGDAVERQIAQADIGNGLPLERAESTERVLAIARAMARNPGRFAPERPVGNAGLYMKIPATVGTIGQMLTDGVMGAERVALIIHDASDSPKGEKRRVTVEARYVFRTNDADGCRVVSVAGDLGRTTRARARDPHWIKTRLLDNGAKAIMDTGYTVHTDSPLRDHDEAAVSFLTAADREWHMSAGASVTPKRDEDVLGPDRCDHRNATWVSQRSKMRISRDEAPISARLECPGCLRERIAVVPLHRFPEGHKMRALATDETPEGVGSLAASYLQWRRCYDHLEGRTDRAENVAALVARDGEIITDPTRYAESVKEPARPPKMRSIRSHTPRR